LSLALRGRLVRTSALTRPAWALTSRSLQRMVTFWAEALGYVPEPPPGGHATSRASWASVRMPEAGLPAGAGDSPESIIDPAGRGPRVWFQQVPEPKVAKKRWPFDLKVGGRGRPRHQPVPRWTDHEDPSRRRRQLPTPGLRSHRWTGRRRARLHRRTGSPALSSTKRRSPHHAGHGYGRQGIVSHRSTPRRRAPVATPRGFAMQELVSLCPPHSRRIASRGRRRSPQEGRRSQGRRSGSSCHRATAGRYVRRAVR
jgi:glyoxalase superfamily protein